MRKERDPETYPERKFDHQAAVSRYKVLLNYTKVAVEFHVSRERIRQIVKKYCPEIKPLLAHLHLDVCTFCGKSESVDKVIVSGKYCVSCKNFIKQVNRPRGPSERYLNKRRTRCVLCGTPFGPRKTAYSRSGKGRCRRCSNRERSKTVAFKEMQKRSWEKHREKRLIKMKQYNKKRHHEMELKQREQKRQERIRRYMSVAID